MSMSKSHSFRSRLQVLDGGGDDGETVQDWDGRFSEPNSGISMLKRENAELRKQVASLQRFQELR